MDQNGLVKAIGVGTAIITAKTNDGGFISTSNITVSYTNQVSYNNPGINNTTNPQTGVAGLSGILGIAGLGLCSIFASRKRKNK